MDIDIDMALHTAWDSGRLKVETRIERGAITAIYGESGVGKTTLLRILAGLVRPDYGHINYGGETWLDTKKRIDVPAQKRGVGFVFQSPALFPNMTVLENLEFACAIPSDKTRIDELLSTLELTALGSRRPGTLSGGQQQRVALARALVRRPPILILDEPFSALHAGMRSKLRDFIIQTHSEYRPTILWATHEVSDIFKAADSVVHLQHDGKARHGSPQNLFAHGKSSGKFQFAGEILAMHKQDFLYILNVLVGEVAVKVAVDEQQGQSLKVGDRISVMSKAFNPLVEKLEISTETIE